MTRTHILVVWLLVLVLVHGALAVVYATDASTRAALADEDGVVEWISVGWFMLAAAIAAWRGRRRGSRLAAVLIGGIAVLGALDELSFGSRLLAYEPPVVAGVRMDAIHDVVDLAVTVLRRELPKAILVAMAIAATAAAVVVAWLLRRRLVAAVRARGPACYALMIVPFAIPAVLIDLHLVGDGHHAVFLEELFESAAAWTWCGAALAIGTPAEVAEAGAAADQPLR